MSLINKIKLLGKAKVEGLHIEIGDYKTLNIINSGIKTITTLAHQVSGNVRMEVNGEKMEDIIDRVSNYRSASKEYKSSEIKRWLDEMSKVTKTVQNCLASIGKAIMFGNISQEQNATCCSISDSVLVPVVTFLGEDVTKLKVAIGEPVD